MLLGVKKPPKTGTLLDDLAEHPRIRAMLMPRRLLGSRKTKLPAYLSARTFSLVLLDTIAPPPAAKQNEPSKNLIARLEDKLDELPDGLQRQLRTTLESVKADDAVATGDTQELESRIDTVKGIRDLQLPVGWTFPDTQAEADPRAFPESIDFWWFVGVVITGLALSFGAPFWFDAISKLSRLRPTGKPEGRAPGTANP